MKTSEKQMLKVDWRCRPSLSSKSTRICHVTIIRCAVPLFHQKKLLSHLSRSYSYQYFYKTVNFIINIITAEWYFLFVGHFLLKTLYCVKKWNFLLIISLVIVNKSAIFCALTKTRSDLKPAETTHIIVFFYIKNRLLSVCVSLNTLT